MDLTIPIFGGGSTLPSSTSLGQGQTWNQGNQQATSTQRSTSYIPEYSQTAILEAIAKQAQQMAPDVYKWGMDQYNKNQGNIDAMMRDARTYASPSRIKQEMGQAQAHVMQGAEAGRQAAERDLQGYGVDPSSGRYAALDKASRVATGAAAAGAGNQQRMATEAAGSAMMNQGLSASMQNMQQGYGAANAANALLGTGMSLKYPPLGQTSAGDSQSTGSTSGGGWNYTSSESGPKNELYNPNVIQTGGRLPTPTWGNPPGGQGGDTGPGGAINPWVNPGNTGGGGIETTRGIAPVGLVGPGSPYYGGGGLTGSRAYADDSGMGPGNPYAGYTSDGRAPSGTNTGGGPVHYAGLSSNPIPGAATYQSFEEGGFVPDEISQSEGTTPDDVPANLTAGEFIIPKDVVEWKGKEFFYGLMAKARKLRATSGNGMGYGDN